MKTMLALVTLCWLGALAAAPVMADDPHRGRRDDSRYERRHDGRDSPRYPVRDERSVRRYASRYDEGYRRHALRYVECRRHCDGSRDSRGAHYHVSPRDDRRDGYPRDAYRLYGRSGIDATLVVTLPLF